MGFMLEIERNVKLDNIEYVFRAAGKDSEVYSNNGVVRKFYKSSISLEQLDLYQKVTDRLKALIDGKSTSDLGLQIYWKVISIKKIGGPLLFKGSLVNYSESRYLPGANFRQIYGHDFSDMCSNQLPRIVNMLGREKDLISGLNTFSENLNSRLDYKGIHLSLPNIKPFYINGRHWFVITDLCSEISNLEQNKIT
jgi:hypothetical protein